MANFKSLFHQALGFLGAVSVMATGQAKAMAFNPATIAPKAEAALRQDVFKTCKVAELELAHRGVQLQAQMNKIHALHQNVTELRAVNRDLSRPAGDMHPSDYAPQRIPMNEALMKRFTREASIRQSILHRELNQYASQYSVTNAVCSRFRM